MSSRRDLRVTKLERAPGAGGVDLRVFGTVAEADADTRPAGSGMEVHVIVTGVARAALAGPRHGRAVLDAATAHAEPATRQVCEARLSRQRQLTQMIREVSGRTLRACQPIIESGRPPILR